MPASLSCLLAIVYRQLSVFAGRGQDLLLAKFHHPHLERRVVVMLFDSGLEMLHRNLCQFERWKSGLEKLI